VLSGWLKSLVVVVVVGYWGWLWIGAVLWELLLAAALLVPCLAL
jgi:hypothetical protein